MDILIFIGVLILGGMLNFIWEPDAQWVYSLAKAYLFLAFILSAAMWIFYFTGIKYEGVLSVLDIWLHDLTHLLLGFLTGYIGMCLRPGSSGRDEPEYNAIVSATIWGISIAIGSSFIVAAIGKATNMQHMIGFFRQSGYSMWLLYFTMAAEALCAIGILLHFKLRTGYLAATCLTPIMLGAIYTHWHNHDPLSYSYTSVVQLINLFTLLIIYYFEKQADRRPPDTEIYVI